MNIIFSDFKEYLWVTKVIIVFSGLSFLFFGISCLFSNFMVIEFKRYDLEKFRIIVGLLQLLGSVGLFIGLFSKNWAMLASLGLAILMAFGFMVRIKIKDPFFLAFPSLFYALLNMILFIIIFRFENK
ncbi:DoxX family protein [Maribacter arcticus]|uniref:DoxX-like family protein n=1 Tax=Maribacter arcticus TaxID=561365 RepID=A0A1T5ACI0_9FLAO|nr:DoxX family protein [Maribacter arcticus]SKB32668.1 DoxX-like family protein [Maribacter arcticus]